MGACDFGRPSIADLEALKTPSREVQITYAVDLQYDEFQPFTGPKTAPQIQKLIARNPELSLINSKLSGGSGDSQKGPGVSSLERAPLVVKITPGTPKRREFNDNPLWFFPGFLHMITLGLIPYTVTKEVNLATTIEDATGKVLRQTDYTNTARIWWWSPLILTGKAKKNSDPTLEDPLYAETLERALIDVSRAPELVSSK